MDLPAEDHLPEYRVRPRFKIETTYPVEDIVEKIGAGLKREGVPVKGQVSAFYTKIYLPKEDQHYWSPILSLTFEETENGSLLRGMYGPRPAVWTMFVFFYSLIGFALMVISIIGLSNLTLDKPATILWLVPILVLTFFSLYLVAFIGQKLGHEQMVILHQFLEKSTGIIIAQ